MECPKCHKIIPDNANICPHCRKVLALICPNCHSYSQNAVCTKCGYIILEKCSKCGKLIPTTQNKCKCGFSVKSSIAYNECEIDEFASVIVNFSALKEIRRLLGSQELYSKFLVKLKNLVSSQLKNCNGQIILYGDSYTINFCRELSFQTSVNKAVRLALKIVTAFAGLNLNIIEQLGTPIKMTVTIIQKKAEDLLINKSIQSNVKLMIVKNESKQYLKGMQIIVDQYCQDAIKEYKTDSLYSLELDGNSVMFYEIILENYVIPPSQEAENIIELPEAGTKHSIAQTENPDNQADIYGFNTFDLNAKCKFVKFTSEELSSELVVNNKIITLKGLRELGIATKDIIKIYKDAELETIYVSCTEDMKYKPWSLFEKIFIDYYKLPTAPGLIDPNFDAKKFNPIKQLIQGEIQKAASPEDSRFKYMELFVDLLNKLRKCAVIIDGFENIDDTSLQTLELYFDKFVKVYTNFVFITDKDTSVHSKIKGLLQTFLYTEITLLPNSMDNILTNLQEDASDFIQSFYYENIKEYFKGSKIYFEHASKYLMDKNVLANFDNKLIIKNSSSFILPHDLPTLIRTRLKSLGKNPDASMILAYSAFLGERLDFKTLEMLGINNIKENVQLLNNLGFTYSNESAVYINNYILIRPIIQASLKKEVEEYLAKTILAKLGKVLDNTTLIILMNKLSMYKEEYLLLWKNAKLSIDSGDYDSYIVNCFEYLSLLDKIGNDIAPETLENHKKEIYQNILSALYTYSPSKVYSIEKLLLDDAINSNDTERIIQLSNIMLQGALITANYSNALYLIHNILNYSESTALVSDGIINTKYLLLSLIHIEILFNIGEFRNCIDIAEEILNIISPEILEKIKPINFSTNSFVNHILDTFKLVSFAKIIACDDNIDEFFKTIEKNLDIEFSEKKCILALKEYISGKDYTPSNIELNTPFAKIIFLILHELSRLKNNYKQFVQNIYQAKLLAMDINHIQLEYLCEILIAFAYSEVGNKIKADTILNDIISKAKKSNMYNILIIARYIDVKSKIKNNENDESLIIINNTLAEIQKEGNQAILYKAMFEKLFIDVVEKENIQSVNLISEMQLLMQLSPKGELERIVRSEDCITKIQEFENKKNIVIEQDEINNLESEEELNTESQP